MVQRVENAIHWINRYPVVPATMYQPHYPSWIVTYPVDSVIHPLNIEPGDCVCIISRLTLDILLQVHLLKQQGPRLMPGSDVRDAGLGE